MGKQEVLSQTGAWEAYDRWFEDDRVSFLAEPSGLEPAFLDSSRLDRPAPKDWADSYLTAFAAVSGLTLVTFDRALQSRAERSILLA